MSKLADIITELEEEGKLPPTYYLNEPQEIAKGVTGYEIYVDWHSYYGATGYRVYRSVDGGSYSMVLDEPVSGYTWYGFWDNDVSPGSTYSYYVTAYGDFGETAPSETIPVHLIALQMLQ
jgi:fibronectin type 3 domain-containing protein